MLELVANELHLSNPAISCERFLDLLNNATHKWLFEWGLIFAIENDLHIHILSHYRKQVFLRKPLREVAFFMFKKYKTITSSVLKNKPNSLAINLKMGWRIVKETSDKWYLEMNKEGFRYGKN